MATPRPARGQADSVYYRHDSAGPQNSYETLWTDVVPEPIVDVRRIERMSDEEIRQLPPPLPQVDRFPPRTGYPVGEMSMRDILSLTRGIVPFAPVGQDGGGAIATSNPSNMMWW
jgi:hypothetical protein